MLQVISRARLSEDFKYQKEVAERLSNRPLKEIELNPSHQIDEETKKEAEKRGRLLKEKYKI